MSNRSQKKSDAWRSKQNKDVYVKNARKQGLRARSSFKLQDIDKKYKLVKAGMSVIDLGAAPGSWSQYTVKRIGPMGKLLSVDLLDMLPFDNQMQFIQGDFTNTDIQRKMGDHCGNKKIDLVLSDMLPNITGTAITDQSNIEQLQYSIIVFCKRFLKKNGVVLTKIFQGESTQLIQKKYKQFFSQVQLIKPPASRFESKEVFLLARSFMKN